MSLRDVLPLRRCTSFDTDKCGGTETRMCKWSFETCPLMISTSKDLQISRIRSRTRIATSPQSTGLRYLVIDDMILDVIDTVRSLAVVLHNPASLLKSSPKGEGFSPIPRGGQ